MRIDRLFNALVLGGAAMSVGCDEEAPPADTTLAESMAGGGGGGEGGVSSAATGGSGSVGEAGSSGGGETGAAGAAPSGGAGSAGEGGETGVGNGDAGPLECTPLANPSDPCGCPCCWVDNCLNDEPCCETFCASGDNGNGCCGS